MGRYMTWSTSCPNSSTWAWTSTRPWPKVTAVPAQVIGMPDEIGTLAVGAWGDAVVLDVRQGQFQLADSGGETRTGDQQLEPLIVVKGGRIYRQY